MVGEMNDPTLKKTMATHNKLNIMLEEIITSKPHIISNVRV